MPLPLPLPLPLAVAAAAGRRFSAHVGWILDPPPSWPCPALPCPPRTTCQFNIDIVQAGQALAPLC
ncbi:hypothetical protein LX32DRAFT_636339 [Colletotrichum zoysiae]|uniref:Uncharacterized protein n=1 Tax=Colletotrichum zoysiae TaxID=1216348 RepID=A0AAD9M5D7_9PEZI|nr:hypothetical protein LX32DRAFT_636339 [Colletotrichum zoysiae]